jgi:O-antigen ligase
VAIASVTAYYTSPRQILWSVEARYPDVWGPFLSRNNFAQFLELTFPAALWLALRERQNLLYWSMALVMLAAGFASASRAGAVLLAAEAIAGFLWSGRGRWALRFAAALIPLAALAGGGTLLYRLTNAKLVDERAPIYGSTLQIIASRPWQGYGLGTYASVYPEFASFDSGHRIEHAHNDWLEFASEGGLIFAGAWAALAVRASTAAWRHPWSWGVLAVFLHALADFPLVRPGIAVWVFFLLGAIESARQSAISTDQESRRRTT